MNPKVSVIMPSLNVVAYIRECIESVVNQTMKEIEVICVDAGSTDGTLEILREYEAKDSRVKVIISEKKSYGYQMNLGTDASTGEYIGIVETDDYILPNMYEELYEYVTRENLDLIKTDFNRFVYEDGELKTTYNAICKSLDYYGKVVKPSDDVTVFKFIMNTWCGIYRTAFIKDNNIRYNETPGASYQDNGFWFQTFALAERAMFLDKAHYMNRRDNPNSSVHSRSKVYCVSEEYNYIREFLEAHPELEEKLLPIYCVKKYDNYDFTYKRIGDEFKLGYVVRFSEEFMEYQEKGILDEELFEPGRWRNITKIMGDPLAYYLSTVDGVAEQYSCFLDAKSGNESSHKLEAENKKLRNEIADIQNAFSYKLARAITAIPRKIRK